MRLLGGNDVFMQGGELWVPRLKPSGTEVPWTLEDIPQEARANGGAWEAKNAQVSGEKITAIPDTFGARAMLQPLVSNQPTALTLEGMPAASWGEEPNNISLVPETPFAPAWMIFVARYSGGVNTTFPANVFPGLVSDGGSTTTTRVSGDAGTANLIQTGWATLNSVNAGPYNAQILPLPQSLVEVRGTPLSAAWSLGRGDRNTDRGWRGTIWAAVMLGIEPTGDLLARIQGRLAWDYGIQGELPDGHPYKAKPPMKIIWTPADLADASWASLADPGTVTTTPEGTIAKVTPKAGTIGLVQTVSARQPTPGEIRGKGAARFMDANRQFMFDGTMPPSATIIAVSRVEDVAATMIALVGNGLDVPAGAFGTAPIVPIGQKDSSLSWQRFEGVLTWRVNGKLVTPETRNDAFNALYSGGAVTLQELHFSNTNGILAVGGAQFSYYLAGAITDVIIVPRALTDDERTKLLGWAKQYGVTG